MTDALEKRELTSIVPEGILDGLIDRVKNLVTWPFKEIAVSYLKSQISPWLKESTLLILDQSKDAVVEILAKGSLKYSEFRESLEANWDQYVDQLLYRLGFVSIPMGDDGLELVAFQGFPLESQAAANEDTESVWTIVLIQIVVPVLAQLIAKYFVK